MAPARPPNIMIGTPTYGDQLTVPYVNAAFKLLVTLQGMGIPHTFQFLSCSNIVEGRNTLVSLFMHRKEFTHLLFWDADMGVDVDVLLSLLKANTPLSGLVYHKKKLDWPKLRSIAATIPPAADLQSAVLEYNVRYPNQIDGQPVDIRVTNGLAEVDALGTGYLLIRRDCAETMAATLPNLRYDMAPGQTMGFNERFPQWALFNCILDEESRRFYGEDYSFCRRWIKSCGGKILGLVDAPVVHAGQMSLTANYIDKLKSGVQ